MTYSGAVRTFTRTNGKEQTILIPENTQNVVFTCEVSRGILFTPYGSSASRPNPTVTTNMNLGGGTYQCYRLISNSFLVLSLEVAIGGEVVINSSYSFHTNIIIRIYLQCK